MRVGAWVMGGPTWVCRTQGASTGNPNHVFMLRSQTQRTSPAHAATGMITLSRQQQATQKPQTVVAMNCHAALPLW
jgi:hypothetical protein